MEKNFTSNYYTKNGKTLSYLISHLDGFSYNDIKNIIVRNIFISILKSVKGKVHKSV
jgi:hypothetical protein